MYDLNERQLDALREVSNIGAAHAATALSQMTQCATMIEAPAIKVVRLGTVSELVDPADHKVVAVAMRMLGDLTGRIVLMLPVPAAMMLCDLLLQRKIGETTALDELERSGLQETANIVGGAYMNALSDFLGMMLLPSVPTLIVEPVDAVFVDERIKQSHDPDFILSVETHFEFKGKGRPLTGHFLLLPDMASVGAIFDAISVT